MSQVDISIIIPIFNEEDSINDLYDELLNSIPHDLEYEIIFVNDGSQDDSSKKIKSIILEDKRVKLVDFFIVNFSPIVTLLNFLTTLSFS